MAGVGAAGLVAQTVLVRELMVSFYGSELALVAALCCWLAFVATGAVLGAVIVSRCARPGVLGLMGILGLAVGLPVEFVLARMVRLVLVTEVGAFATVAEMFIGGALAGFPVAVFVGFLFPAVAAWEEVRGAGKGDGIGRVYLAEAIGSGLVGVVLSLWLLGRVSPAALVFGASASVLAMSAVWALGARQLLVYGMGGLCYAGFGLGAGTHRSLLFFGPLAALALVGAALLLALPGRKDVGRRAAVLLSVLLVLVCAGFVVGGRSLGEHTALARWGTVSEFRLVAGGDTRYQRLELGERDGSYVLARNGVLSEQFPETGPVESAAALLLTQHPEPRRLLVIGGGLGGLCQQLLQSPITCIDYVESDPGAAHMVYDHLPASLRAGLADERFAAYNCDGRFFVRTWLRDRSGLAERRLLLAGGDGGQVHDLPAAEGYDLVVLNVGDPTSAAGARFYTVEFFGALARVLRPGGVVAICGISGDENYVGEGPILDYTACLYATLHKVFPHVVVRPGAELCYFGALKPGVVSAEPEVLVQRFDALRLRPKGLRYAFALDQFPAERVIWVRGLLERAGAAAAINTDKRAIVFTLYLRVQSHYAGGVRDAEGTTDVFSRLAALGPGWHGAPFVLVLIAVLGVWAATGRQRATPWACAMGVFTTGVFAMSAEMMVVYGYQTAFGYVYRDVSMLVGLFMAGLAGGALLVNRSDPIHPRWHLMVLEGTQVVGLLALPFALDVMSFAPLGFMVLSATAGLLTGAEFPLAARVALAARGRAGATAGLLDASDHLGGLVGAAWAGLLLVPVLGMTQAGAVLAFVKLTSLVGIGVVVAPRGGVARR